RRWAAIVLLTGWPLVNWVFISGIPYENPRFLWPALPAIASLIGIGFRTMRERLGARGGLVLNGMFVISITVGLMLGAREHGHTVARKNTDRSYVDWIDTQVPHGTTLLMPGGTLMFEYYGKTDVRDIYLFSEVEVRAIMAGDCPCDYVAVVSDLETTRAELSIAQVFRSL